MKQIDPNIGKGKGHSSLHLPLGAFIPPQTPCFDAAPTNQKKPPALSVVCPEIPMDTRAFQKICPGPIGLQELPMLVAVRTALALQREMQVRTAEDG